MPSEVVNLDEIVPGIAGVEFVYRDVTYHVPGDLDTQTVMEFLALYQDLAEKMGEAFNMDASNMTEAEASKAATDLRMKMQDAMDIVREKLLKVFQISDPSLDHLPFGQQTTMIVLGKILEMMGLATPTEEELPLPPTRKVPQDRRPKARTQRKPPARTTS